MLPLMLQVHKELSMKILILGGTLYAGRHLVEIALQRGIEVTLFHRGETNPELYPTTERLYGDEVAI